MLKQIPSNIEFNNTPIPPYIINNELYLGSRIKIDGKKADNTFGYIKYNFDTKYMDKLDDFVSKRTNLVKQNDYRRLLLSRFDYVSTNYKKAEQKKGSAKKSTKK